MKLPKSSGFFVLVKEVAPTQNTLYKKIEKLEKAGKKLPRELQVAKKKMQKAPKEQAGLAVVVSRSKILVNSPTVDGDLRKFQAFIRDLTRAARKMKPVKMLKATQEGFRAERLRDVDVYRDSKIRFRVGMSKGRKGAFGILAISSEKKAFGCFLVGKLVDEKTTLKHLKEVISLLKKGPASP